MVSLGDINMVNLKDYLKTFFVTKTFNNMLCD